MKLLMENNNQISSAILKFLNTTEIQHMLSQGDFHRIYNAAHHYMGTHDITILTETFIDADINPLLYLDYVPLYYLANSKINIPKLTFPKHITKIKANAFYRSSNIISVIIPSNIKTIEQYAFSNCIGLETVEITEGVESINSSAFSNCPRLKSITIPQSVKAVGVNLFGENKEIKVRIPDRFKDKAEDWGIFLSPEQIEYY